jgi:integrase
LAAVKVYVKLAAATGIIDGIDAARIAKQEGYKGRDAINMDNERKAAGTPTRSGAKKATNVLLTAAQVQALKEQPDTPQGRRDALLMALLLDHGFRVGEVALLTVGAFQTAEDGRGVVVRFYRPKVNKQQTHQHDAPSGADEPLFKQSVKGGALKVGAAGISERNLSGRVRTLGQRIGVKGLSAHDCRHSWATRAVAAGTDAFSLRDAGGWASLDMPSRYVEAATVANERVKL